MKKFIVDPSFWEVFPKATIEILTVEGINNQVVEENEGEYYERLNNAAKEARNYLTEEPFSQNEVVAQWRQAFTQFKTKKGARSSIEALLKRASQSREFFPINPLVDIYNSISLRFGVPCGGEDLAKIAGDLHLGKAQGGESFLPLGAEVDAPALPEEIIYYDHEGAICRCFNWREAQRTMLTEETTNAVLVIEAVNEQQAEVAKKAMAALQEDIERTFGVTSNRQTVTQEQPEITL
ncbi:MULTISPECIES: B3/B4 domain-containing protein [Enterococcus]|uniref:B3/4 protein n=1 Tax=Candidatus Enterococcus mangumiae TaxID=2230878 RepID=A0ABZ2SWB5_9ENTE|nr:MULTISPECIES: B3/4 domain-containing protein [unclassified Enterococcus]MBO0462631.1 B3/4 domain-containing protein [Enterococcus sp. DIV1298c]MBO0489737.1 B3/4 domain-containing protein [Enterococcus sp. DIV1094]MBO1299652.1 B3/4 domain-containing protein [Enterococcus sp. DIV1271a]